jgi:hypothetical protein
VEHEALVARFQEKPDPALVQAQSVINGLPPDAQEKFKALTKHQQVLLSQAPEREASILAFLAVPPELRHQALTAAMNLSLQKTLKKTFPQLLRMFKDRHV